MRSCLLALVLGAFSLWPLAGSSQVVVTGDLARVESLLETLVDSQDDFNAWLNDYLAYYENNIVDSIVTGMSFQLEDFMSLPEYLISYQNLLSGQNRVASWWTNLRLGQYWDLLHDVRRSTGEVSSLSSNIWGTVRNLDFRAGMNGENRLLVEDTSLNGTIRDWINSMNAVPDYSATLNSIDGEAASIASDLGEIISTDIHFADTSATGEEYAISDDIEEAVDHALMSSPPTGSDMPLLTSNGLIASTVQLSGDMNVLNSEFVPVQGGTVITILSSQTVSAILPHDGPPSSAPSLEISPLSSPYLGPWITSLGDKFETLWRWVGVMFRIGFAIALWRGAVRDMVVTCRRVG